MKHNRNNGKHPVNKRNKHSVMYETVQDRTLKTLTDLQILNFANHF